MTPQGAPNGASAGASSGDGPAAGALKGKRVLLVVSGGIAAYKSLELVRLLRKEGCAVTAVLTAGGAQFVTPLSLQALTESKVYSELWSLTDESEMGHIRLSRSADLVVVAPASANMLAKMAAGFADDLASTVLLATDKPVLAAPAMNVRMWLHPATVANAAALAARGVRFVGPDEGVMACHEYGPGRLAEPPEIVAAIRAMLAPGASASVASASVTLAPAAHTPAAPGSSVPDLGRPLAGRHVLVTSGPTHEPVDPVRYLANRSSGRQGHAIAGALAGLGARVTLVSGPVSLPDPPGVEVRRVETAREMLAACQAALPAEAAVCTAAVADWHVVDASDRKLKKAPGAPPPTLTLAPNPDILATLSALGPARPRLVVGFAAETDGVLENAAAKRARKGCDWIVANDVRPETGIMGGEANQIHLLTADGAEAWPRLPKAEVAARLARRIARALAE